MLRKNVAIVAGALVCAMAASIAQAAPMLVSFGKADGTGSGGDGVLTNWTVLDATNSSLAAGTGVNSDGSTAAGISIATAGFGNYADNGATTYGSQGSVPDWMDLDAVRRSWIVNSTGTVTISGLTGSAYQIDIVGVRSTSGARKGDYTVNGSFANSALSGDDFDAYSEGWLKGSVLTWNPVTPNSGSIVLTVAKSSGADNAYLGAMRISTVPEPTSLAFLGSGLLLLAARRRRAAY